MDEEIEDIKTNLKPKINVVSLYKDKPGDVDKLIRFISNTTNVKLSISITVISQINTRRNIDTGDMTLNIFMNKELQELTEGTDKLEHIEAIHLHAKGYYEGKMERICIIIINNYINDAINISQANLLLKRYKDAINIFIPEQLL
jgi:hypothetical protein